MTINVWGSNDPAEVPKGGTGNASLTADSVLCGNGTSAITPTAALTNGFLVIGSTGATPVAALPTGETDEIAFTAGAGSLSVGFADNPIWPGTGALTIPVGTTGQRPGSPNEGEWRFNTTETYMEGYQNSTWVPFSASSGVGSWVFLGNYSKSVTTSGANGLTVDMDPAYTTFMLVLRFIRDSGTSGALSLNSLFNIAGTPTGTSYTSLCCTCQGSGGFANFTYHTSISLMEYTADNGTISDTFESSAEMFFTRMNTASSRPHGFGIGTFIEDAGSATIARLAMGRSPLDEYDGIHFYSSGVAIQVDVSLYGLKKS